MVHQWEKGIYEVVAGNGGVAVNKTPVVDAKGIDPFAVFSYLGIIREALAVTSRTIVEQVVKYAKLDVPLTLARKIDPYVRPLYDDLISRGIKMKDIVMGELEKRIADLTLRNNNDNNNN